MSTVHLPPPIPSARRLAAARSQILDWFRAHDWTALPFQKQTWDAYLAGQSGLIHATTGTGKTYAAWMGPLIEGLSESSTGKGSTPSVSESARTSGTRKAADARRRSAALRILWITPLRALAADTAESLLRPMLDFGLAWSLETHTGDTSSAIRNRQRERLPTVLVTTPESL